MVAPKNRPPAPRPVAKQAPPPPEAEAAPAPEPASAAPPVTRGQGRLILGSEVPTEKLPLVRGHGFVGLGQPPPEPDPDDSEG